MPRGRKRKTTEFIPQPWIPNSSSEDEHREFEPPRVARLDIPRNPVAVLLHDPGKLKNNLIFLKYIFISFYRDDFFFLEPNPIIEQHLLQLEELELVPVDVIRGDQLIRGDPRPIQEPDVDAPELDVRGEDHAVHGDEVDAPELDVRGEDHDIQEPELVLGYPNALDVPEEEHAVHGDEVDVVPAEVDVVPAELDVVPGEDLAIHGDEVVRGDVDSIHGDDPTDDDTYDLEEEEIDLEGEDGNF